MVGAGPPTRRARSLLIVENDGGLLLPGRLGTGLTSPPLAALSRRRHLLLRGPRPPG